MGGSVFLVVEGAIGIPLGCTLWTVCCLTLTPGRKRRKGRLPFARNPRSPLRRVASESSAAWPSNIGPWNILPLRQPMSARAVVVVNRQQESKYQPGKCCLDQRSVNWHVLIRPENEPHHQAPGEAEHGRGEGKN